ncbi:MAG: RusA family crossover junction endodeoxyribonuclease [Cytophagales bacterium]|jgi:Holliday junction resolvase RusA-like endonuclease|nr:RusA family crossover junction endodeoxyribonuclease [Cytophagales bacterium]
MTKPFYVSFVVPGHPFGKQRSRSTKSGRHYTPEETVSYEATVKLLAMQAMKGRPPVDIDVGLMFVAVFPIPKSFTKAQRAAALADDIRPTKKPDKSNIEKALEDGMNGVVYHDDCQITESGGCKKIYGEIPCVKVCVYDRKAFDISVVIKGADLDTALTTTKESENV